MKGGDDLVMFLVGVEEGGLLLLHAVLPLSQGELGTVPSGCKVKRKVTKQNERCAIVQSFLTDLQNRNMS